MLKLQLSSTTHDKHHVASHFVLLVSLSCQKKLLLKGAILNNWKGLQILKSWFFLDVIPFSVASVTDLSSAHTAVKKTEKLVSMIDSYCMKTIL